MKDVLQPIRTHYAALDDRFRDRPLRERAMLGGGAIALLFLLFDALLLRPASDELERIQRLTVEVETELSQLQAEHGAFARIELTPMERQFLERKHRIQEELEGVNRAIAGEVAELVPPEAVISVLEQMLEREPGLSLVRVQSEAPHRVGSATPTESDSEVLETTQGLYRHGLRIEIEGDFASTLHYLERVETSPWHLLWDRLEYRVETYPRARITLDLHTVSEQEEWIGV